MTAVRANPIPTFSTDDLPLAAFLALNGLKFLGCRPVRRAHMEFQFADPEGRGRELELAFATGAHAPAKALLVAVAHLRDAAREAVDAELGVTYGRRHR